jgi:hypothetical protein
MLAKRYESEQRRNVRFGSKADILARIKNVRFTPESGHRNAGDMAGALALVQREAFWPVHGNSSEAIWVLKCCHGV